MLRKVLKISKRYKNVIKRLSLIIVSCIHKAKNLKYDVRLYDEFGFSYAKRFRGIRTKNEERLPRGTKFQMNFV